MLKDKHSRWKTFVAAVVGVLALAAVNASAAMITYTVPSGGLTNNNRNDAGNFTVGSLVQVGASDQLVTALGVQDANNSTAAAGRGVGTDGFVSASHTTSVAIWNATGTTMLASATVSDTAPLDVGNYRYASLATPITLTAGQQYLIGALVGGSYEYFIDNAGGTAPFAGDTGFTLVSSRYNTGGTLAAPLSVGGPISGGSLGRWGPANAQTTPTPEPSTACMLVGGAFMALVRRRRAAIA